MPRIGKLVNTVVVLGLLSAFCSFQLLFRSTAGQSGHHSKHHTKHAMQAPSTSEPGDSSSMQHGSMMMMPMYFMATTDTILWFKGLHTHSLVTYLLSLAGLAGFALLHEALAAFRVTLAKASKPVPEGYSPMPEPATGRKALLRRAGISGLYALNLTTGYLLMLAVMTYNVGYFIVIICSMGLGHFLFHSGPLHAQHIATDTCCETIMEE